MGEKDRLREGKVPALWERALVKIEIPGPGQGKILTEKVSIIKGEIGLGIEKGPDPSEMVIAVLETTTDLIRVRADGRRSDTATTMMTGSLAIAMEDTDETLLGRTMIVIPATDQDTTISTEDIKNIVHIKCPMI